MDRLTLFVYFV